MGTNIHNVTASSSFLLALDPAGIRTVSTPAIEAIIGLVGWVVYTLVIVRLVRRWLLEGRISDTQAAFLITSRTGIAFLFGAIIVAIDSGGINGVVIYLFLLGVFITAFETWATRWIVPDLRQSVRRDWLRKHSRAHEDDRHE